MENEKFAQYKKELELIIEGIVEECHHRGLDLNIIEENVDELSFMFDKCFDKEVKLCKEVIGRPPTREEMIAVFADMTIKYIEQKQKINNN